MAKTKTEKQTARDKGADAALSTAGLELAEAITGQVGRRIVGQQYMVERIMLGLLTGGHVLLEGVPGLAKTLTIRTIA
jgi:MoxR-like ATPase